MVWPGVVVHTLNPSLQETEAADLCDLEASLVYIVSFFKKAYSGLSSTSSFSVLYVDQTSLKFIILLLSLPVNRDYRLSPPHLVFSLPFLPIS